jgi:hypothetical protein
MCRIFFWVYFTLQAAQVTNMRVKGRWFNKKSGKTPDQVASALAFNIWKYASTTVNQLYSSGFDFKSNQQILDVIGEFAVFSLQLVDRLSYGRISDEDRSQFINLLASSLVRHMVDNRTEEQGDGNYAEPFINFLNQRLDRYADFEYVDGNPPYHLLRYFGSCVSEMMSGNNKWIQEQIIDVEAPKLIKMLQENFDKLFVTADFTDGD